MTPPRTVFVGSDFILNEALDAISDALADDGVDIIRGPRATPTEHPRYRPQHYRALFAHAEVILTTTRVAIGGDLLDAAPQLRAVVFPSVGVDTIDVDDATVRGLVVAHAPVPEIFISMAESTVMLIAALMLGLDDKMRQLAGNLPRPAVARAGMMHGRTIGLVGLGRISRAVIERLAGFGVHILVYDHAAHTKEIPPGVRSVDLATLLRDSDVVSLHVTLGADSTRLIGEPELRLMKTSAFLINTARGNVVDEVAVCRALQQRWIAGAALDTFETEPLPQASPLRGLDNVILTNHCVGHTRDIAERIVPVAVENITRILAGRAPLYTKNPDVLPAWLARYGVAVADSQQETK